LVSGCGCRFAGVAWIAARSLVRVLRVGCFR